jgi:hypothetical protein
MITLTPDEELCVKLTIAPETWAIMMHPRKMALEKTDEVGHLDIKYLGLTVEQFDRSSPLADQSAYGIETQYGPLIAVYTFLDRYGSAKPYSMQFKLGFNTGRQRRLRVMSFELDTDREQFLKSRDYPFQVSEYFF